MKPQNEIRTVQEFNQELMRTVRRVLKTSTVKPGFQYLPEIVNYEAEVSFATGMAVAAFARDAQSRMTKREKIAESEIVRQLFSFITARVTSDELSRQCLNVSIICALMLEQLGIWTVVYLGTLLYDSKEDGHDRMLYYVDDLISPPPNSAARGHSWIFTPALPVIDLTAKHQELTPYLREHVPCPVIVKREDEFKPQHWWYISKNDSIEESERKQAVLRTMEVQIPNWNEIHKKAHFENEHLLLHYIPMSLYFGAEPLEQTNFPVRIGGETPVAAFERFKRDVLSNNLKA
jgi:hypothetical protein